MAGDETKPKVKVFDCTACGAAITIRNPASLVAACPTCHAVIDIRDGRYRLLSAAMNFHHNYPPAFELGQRGKLFGRKWEVLGHIVRRDATYKVGWNEYLLFNPYYGYRWLIEQKGHWLFATPTKEKPDHAEGFGFGSKMRFRGHTYRLFDRGSAEVVFVNGEFYWKVKVGDRVQMEDYIAPPYMLSGENNSREIVWVHSQYIDLPTLRAGFDNIQAPPQFGIAPAQPSHVTTTLQQIAPYFWGFLVLLTIIQMAHASMSMNRQVLAQQYPIKANVKVDNAITTPTFVLEGAMQNVELILSADADNSWVYVSGELVNDKTGETYPFERSVEYYHGYDGGEYWSEGGTQNSLLISRVPTGLYYLNIDYQSGDYKVPTARLDVKVIRGVTMYSNYFWALLFLSIMPVIYWLRSRSFEVERWAHSDFSPYQSSE